MCTSVPQIPVRSTLISTSLIPIRGTGTSSSQRPGLASFFTRASIVSIVDSSSCVKSIVPLDAEHFGRCVTVPFEG